MCDYRFHFLVAGDNGEVEKWRISCELDMRNVSAMFTIPTIYVTLQPKHSPSPYTQASVPMYPSYGYPGGFMNLFAAQGPPLYPYGVVYPPIMSQPSTSNPANNDNMVPDTSKRVESNQPGASRHSPEHVDWGVDSGFNGYSTGNDEGDGEGHDEEVDDEFDDGGDDEVDDEGDDEVDDEGFDNEQFCDPYNNETNMNDNPCNDDLLNDMDDNIDDPDFIIEEDEDISDNVVSPSNMMGGLNEHILRNKKSIAIHNVPRLDLSGGVAIEEDDLNEIATRSSSGWRIPEANFHNVDVHPSSEEPSMIDRELAKGVVIEKIMGDMERDHGIKLKYDTSLRSQNAAYDFMYRDHKKSWELLLAYFHMSMKENPGTSAYIETDKDDVFEYAFISFHASPGFLSYCRPVIVIDGTHLKGKYKGILFVATTKDKYEQIFPLAFGIGDKECHNAWMWFLQKLRSTFGCPENLVIVSDRHPRIKSAMEVVYPEVVHAICSYHLRQNIRSHGSKAVGLYMKASYTYSPVVYEKSVVMLAAKHHKTWEDLIEAIPTRWARSQCPVRRYSFMTSNACEVLNNRLRWARKIACLLIV
ncbi:Unknown protein [Striga hermonthica]|uniref:MULE transposase domain-containing protein n=1 Tax=Striga hermonthica TaxID=68872 RepID=A0A9N7RJY1_STRHE|nr:Unknown protein [Striga hermonthica]